MARGTVNKAILIGRLGADPELRHTTGGTPVANFNIATDEGWTDGSGEKQERTEWHSIVAWSRSAEMCSEYLSKGSRVYIEGRIQTRSWEGPDGVKKYKTEIVARHVEMLDTRQEAERYREQDYREAQAPSSQEEGTPQSQQDKQGSERQEQRETTPGETTEPSVSEEDDDDLPF